MINAVPKLWFARGDNPLTTIARFDCDCNACPSANDGVDLSTLLSKTDTYRLARALIWQGFDGKHHILANPAQAGVVVVDDCAAALLDYFRSEHTTTEVCFAFPHIPHLRAFLEQLIRLGLLEATDAPLVRHQWHDSDTLTVWMHVTNECNLRCLYCYLDKTDERMSAATGKAAVDAVIRSAVTHGFKQVILKYAGGEASMRLKMVLDMHRYAQKCTQATGLALEGVLLTNGVLMSERTIQRLIENKIRVTISLDGIGSAHDTQRPLIDGRPSFAYVDRAIRRLLAANCTPMISVTVSQLNLTELPSLVQYLLTMNLPFNLNFYRENDCSLSITDLRFGEAQIIETLQTAFRVIEQQLPMHSLLGMLLDRADLSTPHRHTCGVGHNYMVIDHHGGVAKCQMEITAPVSDVNAADPLQAVRADQRGIQNLAVDMKEGCRDCQWRYWCTGGCPLMTYRATGRYDVQSPNCRIYTTLYPDLLRLEALRLLKYESAWMLDAA